MPRAPTSVAIDPEALVTPDDTTLLDAGVTLALVIGPDGDQIEAVTVALDVVRRDVPDQQAVLARSYPTHTPLALTRVPVSELGSLAGLRLRLKVDGEPRQDGSIADLVAPPDVLVASIARRVRLQAGDIVLVGTPPGTAFDRGGGWLRPGSELVATVDGVAQLRTHVGEPGGRPPRPPAAARGNRVFVTGTNSRSHLDEMGGGAAPEFPTANLLKLPDAVCGTDVDIVLPSDTFVDYEGELAVVIGVPTHHVTVDQVDDVVMGVCLANDVTARDAPTTHLALAKNGARFCPLGPVVAVSSTGLDDLSFTVRVNGELRQCGHSRDMIHSIRDVVASYSAGLPLEPGDVILTGSPAGVGVARRPPVFLQHGDTVEIESPQLGRLANRFVSSTPPRRNARSERS